MGPFEIGAVDFAAGLFLALFVVTPFSTLVHELGHAFVALRVSRGPVVVHVGRPPIWFGVDFERLKVRWSAVPPRGVPFAGLCLWNTDTVSNRSMLAVVLAGPIAGALLIPAYVFAAICTATLPAWIPAAFGWSAFIALIALLANADPRTAASERTAHGIGRRDGPVALAAYRAWRAE